jgi:F-type H+-transporting ATPase subunit delta
MSAINVAKRYGTALLEEAQAQGVLEVVFQDIKLISESAANSRELNLMLKSPIVTIDKKLSALDAIFGKKVNALTNQFLKMLVHKRRESNLLQITVAFFEAYNELKNIKEVELISATELNESMVVSILDKVKSQLNGVNLNVTKVVDPAILGGFVIKIGDRVYDTSVLSKLNALKREILVS